MSLGKGRAGCIEMKDWPFPIVLHPAKCFRSVSNIICLQVINDLDGLKKSRENHYAREAIKYFENMFKNGNWWLRSQGEQETLPVRSLIGR